MLREAVKKHYTGMNTEFRYRGEEQTRIETLSDAGFALAIGLLLISTTSPNTIEELIQFTEDVIPFGMCIALITLVWYQHFIFFIRYGFRNSVIVALNTLLLFLILFYVYPLKFLTKLLVLIYGHLFSNLIGFKTSMGEQFENMIGKSNVSTLMIVYGLGAAGIFFVLMLMYRYALKKAAELELNEIERFDTKVSIYSNLLMGSIPLLSVLIVIVIPYDVVAGPLSGLVYFLYFPVMTIYAKKMSKKRKKLLTPAITPVQ